MKSIKSKCLVNLHDISLRKPTNWAEYTQAYSKAHAKYKDTCKINSTAF